MINSIYQILLLGEQQELTSVVQSHLETMLQGMQISKLSYRILFSKDFHKVSLGINPTVALYFTGDKEKVTSIISELKSKSVVIIPIVDSFDNAAHLLPEILKEINGAPVKDTKDTNGINEVCNHVLTNLGLLTRDRNVFISYKRIDTKQLANQLYNEFMHSGYNVFLDTESLSMGVNFQKSLRHRLADSFVLVLLNSEHFFDANSKWTLEEYNTAQQLQIGICSIMMPNVSINRKLNFSDFVRLEESDFVGVSLKDLKLEELVLHIKSIYARLYESRKQSLTNAFTAHLQKRHINFVQEIDGTLSVTSSKLSCKIIPLIGIPKSWDYYVSDLKQQKNNGKPVFLLYNDQCILDEWLKHLSWLEEKSGVHTININESSPWIQTNL